MRIKILIVLNLLAAISSLAANVYSPRMYLEGYAPIVYNQRDIYKLNKGLNFTKTQAYSIQGMAPTRKDTYNREQDNIRISLTVEGQTIVPDLVMPFNRYSENIRKKIFRSSLLAQGKIRAQATQPTQTGLIREFVIDLPTIAMPRAVQRVLGSRAGRLNLDGTQKLSLEGSSTKRKRVPIYETENNARFDMKMNQETNLRLSGTIGEKIAVNLKYNSQMDEQIFDPNNINIKYTGDEDEIVKSIEAGNITLSLTGSRYISYSTSSQGLFGVTSKFKYGNLDLSVIASKEEGQKNTQTYLGTSQADSTIFRSKDYAARTMYFINDPYELYELYTEDDLGPNVPQGYVNNAVKTDPTGAWIIKNPQLLPKPGSVKLYLDDANVNNNIGLPEGDPIYMSENDFYVPIYEELIEGTDFVTNYNAGTIQVMRALDRRSTLAVRYVQGDNTPIPANSGIEGGILHAKPIRRRNQEYNPDDPDNVWHYQMRNVYNMNKTNIKNDGFTLQIYTENVDRTRNFYVPDSLAAGTIATYTDYLRMDSSGDGLINGDDNTVNLAAGLVTIPFLEPFKPLGDGIVYQDENESIYYQDIAFFMSVKGKIGREAIELGQGGILKGSVRVLVNSRVQRENIDYLVDYDFGRITFLTSEGKDPDAKIEIDYEYRSTFAVARKTLAGFRADWNLTDYAKLGGTLIYRSESVNDKRPRIGNENIQMWMANIDGTINLKPRFLTRWLDALPLIATNAESRVTLSGEIAYTIPSIYGDPDGKQKSAYIDDMESIVDSYPLGSTISTWSLGSRPWATSLAKGRTIWYNPKNIRREQLEDPSTLTEREKKETVTVLALKVFPNNLDMPGSTVWSWGGIMKYLGNQLDFSQKKYIEIMVKVDTREGEPTPNAILHIDLGDLNEDYYTEFGGLGTINKEDKNNDGVLTLEEDTGLDGIRHGEPGHDPNDLASNQIDPQTGDYPYINGTENNGILDTEDLNGDGVLSQLDRYFSYAVSLNDSLHLENINHDGWRVYRIPVTDPAYYQIVNNYSTGVQPTLKKISYARIWLETNETAKVLIADASVVGNKWQDFYVRNQQGIPLTESEMFLYNTTYISGIVNNQKNRMHYTPPPGTVYIEDRRETNESALTLSMNNLQPGNHCLLRQRLFDPYSLLSYDKIQFWIYPEAHDLYTDKPDSLDIIFRVGADSLNYYQINQRVAVIDWQSKMDEDAWINYSYELQQISALKEINPTALEGSVNYGTYTISYKGRPTLTNIRDIFFGLENPTDISDPKPYTGTIYFNDLRVADPYEDIGIAKRVSLNTAIADFITLDINYEDKSENFNPNIQRGRSNTFTSQRNFDINNKYFLQKLFPASWNLDIPLNLSRTYSKGIPRFRANSDLLRDKITDPIEKEREQNESLIYAADIALSMRNAPRNKILEYTLYRTSFSARYEDSYRQTPTTKDDILSWRGTLNYNLSFPSDKVSIPLLGRYRVGWFPTTWNNSFTFNSTQPESYNWEIRENVPGWYDRPQIVDTRVLTTDNNVNWALLSDLSVRARLNTKRDLIQKNYFKTVNLGKETEYVQDLELSYNPAYLPRVFNFSATLSTKYSEYQRKYSQTVDGAVVDLFQLDGGNTRGFRTNLVLQNSSILNGWARKLEQAHQVRTANRRAEESRRDAEQNPSPGEEIKPEELSEEPVNEPSLDPMPDKDLPEDELRRLEEERIRREELLKEMEGNPEQFPEMKPEDQLPPADPGQDNQDSIGPYIPGLIVKYVGMLKNINLSYQNSYAMNFTRKEDRPSFPFMIGLPHSVAPDFLDATTNDNTLSLSSGLSLGRAFDSVVAYSYSINKRYSDASNQTVAMTFPDLSVTFSGFDQWFGMSRYVSGSRLNSAFQYTVRQSGNLDWIKPKQETLTTSFSPLIGITTNVMNALSVNLSYSISRSLNTTDMESYNILKTNDSQTLNGSFSYSFRAGRGFTIPFTKKRIHINNELSSSLNLAYEKNHDETKGLDATQVDRDTSRFSITPGATYQFDRNIRGGLTSSFEVTTNKKMDDGTTIFRIGVWVEVNL